MTPSENPTIENLPAKAARVYELLIPLHGERPRTPRREPLHELVSTLLSHRTTEAQEAAAYQKMWETFGSYEAIRVAPFEELVQTLRGTNWPEVKAANVQKVLTRVADEERWKPKGEISIDFLADLETSEALQWLLSLPGVGLKTATLVLLFCFGKPVLPVDTHLHRVCGRIGLIPETLSAERAHAALLALFPPDDHVLYNFHINVLRHGQQICVWKSPRCSKCPLTEICDFYARNRS